VRWNGAVAEARYAELLAAAGRPAPAGRAAATLAERLEELGRLAGLPQRLADIGVAEADLSGLAADAAEQWTGRYNPRPFDGAAATELYRAAFA
jgi:alcohol dehydrogenase